MSRKIRDAFEPVKADRQMKEQAKEKLLAKARFRGRKAFYRRPAFYRAAVGVLLLALIFAGSMRRYEVKAEAAYITMEGPVQIGLSVNKKNAVISAKGLNSDGESVVSQVDVSGMYYEEALREIMETDSYRQCQGGKARVKVSCHDEEQESAMQQSADKTCHAYGRQYRKHQSEENYKPESGKHHSEENYGQESGGRHSEDKHGAK